MDFRLLGSFEARHEGVPVTVSARRQERCLLAILLLEPDRMVLTDRIADLLWNGKPPVSARSAIHTYVGRLRRTLSSYGIEIETRGDGYLVRPGSHWTDVDEFTALVQAAADTGDPAVRVDHYDAALSLWRGQLLADVADDSLRDRLGSSLLEMRLSIAELRAEAHLRMGLHDRVVTDLGGLVEAEPLRERLVASLMTALYRGGRQADALARYRRTRELLIEELGIEPGTDLRALHERILRADPSLDRSPQPVYAIRVGGQWLPWNTSGHSALEFCNTYAGWRRPPMPKSDWLLSYDTLAVWSGYHDLVEAWNVKRLLRAAASRPDEAAEALVAARTFRAHLYAAFIDPDDAVAFTAVAKCAEEAAKMSVFRRGDDGLGRWTIAPEAGLRLPLYAVARCAADLLADPRRFTLHACPSPECGWLFLDRSGARRFCSIATCGRAFPEAHERPALAALGSGR